MASYQTPPLVLEQELSNHPSLFPLHTILLPMHYTAVLSVSFQIQTLSSSANCRSNNFCCSMSYPKSRNTLKDSASRTLRTEILPTQNHDVVPLQRRPALLSWKPYHWPSAWVLWDSPCPADGHSLQSWHHWSEQGLWSPEQAVPLRTLLHYPLSSNFRLDRHCLGQWFWQRYKIIYI